MNLSDLRAAAERAKQWRPDLTRSCECVTDGESCQVCLGAQRAVEDIHRHVDAAIHEIKNNGGYSDFSHAAATTAARIASYFGDPGAVGEFARLVQEATR